MRDTNKEKGITLIALVITIIILLIIASISTYTGINTIKSSKLTKFKQELEIMQAEVDLLYEDCKNDDGTLDTNKINSIGKDLNNLDTEEINDIFNSLNIDNTEDYRYYDTETIENLGISGVENEYLVSIKDRDVISIEGFESDGVLYRNLYQFPDKERVEGSLDRGEVTFSVDVATSTNGWDVTISDIKYSKYVGKGKILYQQVGEENWTTLVTEFRDDEYSFVIQEPGEYNIKIIDAAGIEKTTEDSIIIEALGNYLVDGTTYYDTLQEAVDGASDGSTIKVMNNVSEPDGATINKEIMLDTNGKTIDLGSVIHIETDGDVIIKGNGTIKGESSIIKIANVCELQLKDVVLNSTGASNTHGLIFDGESDSVIVDNSNISSISMNDGTGGSNININSGSIGGIYITFSSGGENHLKINGGTINTIYYGFDQSYGGTLQIYGGEIENINIEDPTGVFATDGIIIGNPNETVSKTNPYIHGINDAGCANGFSVQFNSGAIVNNGVISFVPRSGYTVTTEYNSDKQENVYVLTQ